MNQAQQTSSIKQTITFSLLTVFGAIALLVGIYLIIFMQYHERAYSFLGLGAACFIGGFAGIAAARAKVKTAISYSAIALGMVGLLVGLNYLTYTNHIDRGYIVLTLSSIAILAGIAGGLLAQRSGGFAVYSSVIMLGVVASLGLVSLIVGVDYLLAQHYQGHAYTFLSAGVVFLLIGLSGGVFAQTRMRKSV